jgi:Uma2 family endonuclease
MDTILDRSWTTESFLAWEDRQEFKYGFDGQRVIPMTGGSLAHQRIAFHLCLALMGLVGECSLTVVQEMRLRIGPQIRYPDVVICAGPLEQTTRTLTDALVVFEVLSNDAATTDRVIKLRDYAAVPSLRSYVLLELTAVATTLFHREPGGEWLASAHIGDSLVLPDVDIPVPLADLYRGLTFPT